MYNKFTSLNKSSKPDLSVNIIILPELPGVNDILL